MAYPEKKQKPNISLPPDRVPPQNIEAEESVLGALMIDKNAITKVADLLLADDFYRGSHQKIYEIALELFSKNEPIDILTVSNRLKEKGSLETCGGSSYLTSLVNKVPTSSNILHYAKIIHQKKVLRDLIGASYEIAELSWQESEDIDTLLDQAEKTIFSISQRSIRQEFTHLKDDLTKAFERIDQLNKGGDLLRGVPTGFRGLDNYLAGLQKSDVIVLAARPSLGKSSLALDIARQAAVKENIGVGIFTLEMSREQVTDRLIAAQSGVDLWKIRTGKGLDDQGEINDFTLLRSAMSILSEAPIYIDDASSPSVIQMRAMARRLQTQANLGLIIVDYLQLVNSSMRTDNMVQQVTEISRSLKVMARELNVPVLVCSQLSRAVMQRSPQIPRLSDLRESGSIEQDADVVLFIYRKDREKEFGEANAEDKNIADIIIAKHRNGPVGQTKLRFNEQITSFRDLEPNEGYSEDTTYSE